MINFANDTARAEALVKDLSHITCTHNAPTEPRFQAIKADMSSPTAITNLVASTVEAMGRLDVIVSNHGWTRMTGFTSLSANTDMEDWEKCFRMNVTSHLQLAAAAQPHLETTGGAFICTSSVAGLKPSGSSLAYSVTKSAQIHLIKGLAVLCAPNIRVNSVSPGMMPQTEWGQRFSAEKREAQRAKTKLGKLATVEDVSRQIKCLAESETCTGSNVVIDGGSSL